MIRLLALGVAGALLTAATPALAAEAAVVVLRWQKVPGVSRYVVEIAEDESFAAVLAREEASTNVLRWRPPSDQRTYYYRVKSVSASGEEGTFSAPKVIGQVLAPPQARAPRNGARVECAARPAPVTLQWVGSRAASRYRVQIKRGASVEELASEGPQLTWRPPGLGAYQWQVAAVDREGTSTAFGPPQHLDVVLAPPRLSGSKKNAVIAAQDEATPVTLAWEACPGADVELQLGLDPRFKRVPVVKVGRRESYETALAKHGQHYWRVRARAGGRTTAWSETASFKLHPPGLALVAPAAGAVVRLTGGASLRLAWEPVAAASRYVVELAHGGAAPSQLEATSAELEVHGPAEGTATWRVSALDEDGQVLDVSQRRDFTVALAPPLAAPELLAPSDGGSVTRDALRLSWSAVDGAAAYDVEVAPVPELSGASPQRVSGTSFAPPAPDPLLYWRVRSIPEQGEPGAWSATRTLKVMEPPLAVALEPIAETQPRARWQLGPFASVRTHFDAGLFPQVGAQLWVRPTQLPDGVFVATSISYVYGARRERALLDLRSTLHRAPIFAGVGLEPWPVATFRPYALAGLVLDTWIGAVRVPDLAEQRERGLSPGGSLRLGGSTTLGAGDLFGEAAYTNVAPRDGLFRVGGHALELAFGYRLTL